MSGAIEKIVGTKEFQAIHPPDLPPPKAKPEVGKKVKDLARRRQRQRHGRDETFLTGDLVPKTTKKRRLG